MGADLVYNGGSNVIAEQDFDAPCTDGNYGTMSTVTFSDPPTLAANTQYALVFYATNGPAQFDYGDGLVDCTNCHKNLMKRFSMFYAPHSDEGSGAFNYPGGDAYYQQQVSWD